MSFFHRTSTVGKSGRDHNAMP